MNATLEHPPMVTRLSRAGNNEEIGERLPAELRNMGEVMVETFKSGLDAWLGTVPDQTTLPGRQRGAATNSLLDQVLQLNLSRTILHIDSFVSNSS